MHRALRNRQALNPHNIVTRFDGMIAVRLNRTPLWKPTCPALGRAWPVRSATLLTWSVISIIPNPSLAGHEQKNAVGVSYELLRFRIVVHQQLAHRAPFGELGLHLGWL